MKIFVDAKSFTTEDECDMEDEWDRPDTDTTWTFKSAYYAEKPKSYDDLDLEIGDDLDAHKFVVIAVWSDGDSFGNDSCRNAEAVAAFATLEEATVAHDHIIDESRLKHTSDGRGVLPTLDLGNGFKFSPAWYGYFESLDYVEILEVTK